MGRAEDDHDALCRSQAVSDQPDDAVDDAADADVLLILSAQWPFPLLGGF